MKPSSMAEKSLKTVLIFGPPGSGKGTQAELLSDKFGFSHFETAKMLERWIEGGSSVEIDGKEYTPEQQRKLWETGILMDPPLVAYLGAQEVKSLHEEGSSIVTSGAFRTVFETENLYPVFEELYGKENITVIFFKLSEEQTLFRNSHRRICELARHPILYVEETKDLTICPLDGSKLVKREGLDDPETIKVRLKEYAERTLPVMDLFQSKGVEPKEINGDQSVADVFKDILKVVQ